MIDWRIGDLPAALADFEDNSFHACLCDPSYGLSDPPPPDLLLKWLAGEEVDHSAGFLGRAWDSLPPGPTFWRELYRVLRPGAIVMAFSHSRTMDLQGLAMRMSGLEILPTFAWLHAESQALGANIGKLIDKAAGAERQVVGESSDSANRVRHCGPIGSESSGARGWATNPEGRRVITAPVTPLAQLFDGHHSRVKSNYEPIPCAMKPLDGCSFAVNAARWGSAGFDVEAGRIPTVNAEDDGVYAEKHASVEGLPESMGFLGGSWRGQDRTNGYSPAGRFPSLPLISHAIECEVGGCVPGCPAVVLAEQSGELGKSSGFVGGAAAMTEGNRSGRADKGKPIGYGDTGTASRFFFQARPARKERSAGCERLYWKRDAAHADGWRIVDQERFDRLPESDRFEGNPTPALKSLELTRYLAKLIRQPGEARLIVPFSGSGSEAIGAILGGWEHVVAIEGSSQMVEVSRRREIFWRAIMESGAEGSIKELLGEHGPPPAPKSRDAAQMGLW